MSDSIRVFVGSGEASLLERKTLIYSLNKNTSAALDITVFNGSHNALIRTGQPPQPAPLPLEYKCRPSATEFSLYRYLIPELCGHRGRAIWLDSDMVCLGDIAELDRCDLGGLDFLAKPNAYDDDLGPGWGASVLVIDCQSCRFDLERIFDDIDAQRFSYKDFMQFTPRFLEHHPYRIGALAPGWNEFDRADENTRLIHYTNLRTQPWRVPGHPYGDLWFEYFNAARAAGEITPDDVELTVMRGFCRPDILFGNSAWGSLARRFRDLVKATLAGKSQA